MMTKEQLELTKAVFEQANLSANVASEHWRTLRHSGKALIDSLFDQAVLAADRTNRSFRSAGGSHSQEH